MRDERDFDSGSPKTARPWWWTSGVRSWSGRSAKTTWICLGVVILVLSLSRGQLAPPGSKVPEADHQLQDWVRAYRSQPSPAIRESLVQYIRSRRGEDAARGLVALGTLDFESGNYPGAIESLTSARTRLPKAGDRIAFLLASAQAAQQQYKDAAETAAAIWTFQPPSPLAERAVLLAAQAWLDASEPKRAYELLRSRQKSLPEPDSLMLLAKAAEANGDAVSAAGFYQRVFYGYPVSEQARLAEPELTRLSTSLGDGFPPANPPVMLQRAYKLVRSGAGARARRELDALIPQLKQPERDLAQVRSCSAYYFSRDNRAAFDCFKKLTVQDREADAERLYYLHMSARRLDRDQEALDVAADLRSRYPASDWRLETEMSAANMFVLKNDGAGAEPYWKACYTDFPNSTQAAFCHWKTAWSEYIDRGPDAARRLREHIEKYPASEQTAAAMYFLGRLSEKSGDKAGSARWYRQLTTRFPNYFYSTLARPKLHQPDAPATPVELFSGFTETAATSVRLERARLFTSMGFDDWAESELEYGARSGGAPHVLAVALAESANRRGAPDVGIRYIKRLAGGYLSIPMEAAPEKFWKLAFPLPYREPLEQYAAAQSLDPYLLAALIRQESEFNTRAVSRAKAYGLTQVMPSTGRELSRAVGVSGFRADMLFEPETNLKLGSLYLRRLLDQLDGEWELALAAYNAGKTRVTAWRTWHNYEEPAEFIESIPFTETRNYVQMVMRNADVYRRLYGSPAARVTSGNAQSSSRGN